MEVRRRSGGACEVGSVACTGRAAHFHHRQLRRHGNQGPDNCLHVCAACHDHIHGQPGKAYLMGWLVHEWADPSMVPLRRGAS